LKTFFSLLFDRSSPFTKRKDLEADSTAIGLENTRNRNPSCPFCPMKKLVDG